MPDLNPQEIRAAILEQLRHGPLTLPELAAAVNLAPFHVHAWLKVLRRERKVSDSFGKGGHLWRLTTAGELLANHNHQLRLA